MSAGVDIIDLKEPRRGALSPAEPSLWTEAASLCTAASDRSAEALTLSAALGERQEAMSIADSLPAEFRFAKVGPSGCDRQSKLSDLWTQVSSRLDQRIELVAVAYADFDQAACLEPAQVFAAAARAGLHRCLIDTFCKDGRSTLDHLGVDGLETLSRLARREGLWWALAGTLRIDHLRLLRDRQILPDCFGTRGDVCERGRTGTLSPARIEAWQRALKNESSESDASPLDDSTRPVQAG